MPAAVASASALLRVIPARSAHCFAVGADITEADAVQLRHAFGLGMSAGAALDYQRLTTTGMLALVGHNTTLAVFGCSPRNGFGVPWVCSTQAAWGRPLTLLRHVRRVTDAWAKQFGELRGWVWEGSPAVRWLPLVGYTIGEATERQGVDGSVARYHPFYR